jgi:hypothetical protein
MGDGLENDPAVTKRVAGDVNKQAIEQGRQRSSAE